jgi:putative addiction module antidote
MAELKLISVGNSVGVVLPKELLVRLGLQKGDTLHTVETPDGFRLMVADDQFESQMTEARRIMKERYAVLRELAK